MADKVKPPLGVGPKYLEITFDDEANPVFDVHGCTDSHSCRAATKLLEARLGLVKSRVDTTQQGVQRRVQT